MLEKFEKVTDFIKWQFPNWYTQDDKMVLGSLTWIVVQDGVALLHHIEYMPAVPGAPVIVRHDLPFWDLRSFKKAMVAAGIQ